MVFYYSGHARARSLSLDDEEVPLDTLRKALTALPSTLTVVVLDACQSGAFSGVKGAVAGSRLLAELGERPAQPGHRGDGLEYRRGAQSGIARARLELLQPSPDGGLRGAGDSNADGRVSLDEAYGYAYQNTLSDTARTQVGTQHATLETDIRGRGDVPLSYPVDADSQLLLPADLAGRVLVQRAKDTW